MPRLAPTTPSTEELQQESCQEHFLFFSFLKLFPFFYIRNIFLLKKIIWFLLTSRGVAKCNSAVSLEGVDIECCECRHSYGRLSLTLWGALTHLPINASIFAQTALQEVFISFLQVTKFLLLLQITFGVSGREGSQVLCLTIMMFNCLTYLINEWITNVINFLFLALKDHYNMSDMSSAWSCSLLKAITIS